MGYGYEWLRKPVMRPNDPNQRLATCDLSGIAQYLCPTTGGDPWKCLECRGFKSCTAGQRAMVLLDEETKSRPTVEPKETDKPKEPHRLSEETRQKRLQKGRERCEQALLSGDLRRYIVDEMGLSEGSVKNTIRRWKAHYPDLFEKDTHSLSGRKAQADKTESLEAVDDLIDLEDFLAVFELKEKPAEEAPKEKSAVRELADLMGQEAELLHEIAGLQETVWEIRKKRKKIESMMSH